MALGYFHLPESNEQDAVSRIARLLVRQVGWTLVDDIANSGSDRDVVLSSPGESSVDNPNIVYIRLRGNGNQIIFSTYETYTDSVTFTGENSDATYGNITASGDFDLLVAADLERVIVAIREDGGNRYFGYVGRIEAYTQWPAHPYPLLIKGMQSTTYDFFYSANPRNMWMIRADGTSSPYYAARVDDDNTINTASLMSVRNGKTYCSKIPVRYSDNPTHNEIAGELRGVYTLPGDKFTHGSFFTIDSQAYVIIQGDGTYSWAVGPVSEDTSIPPEAPSGIDLITSL